ncbi:MAG: hypothetical protein ACW98D_20550 [Promethearchaeota archaeon]|jgi:hypothetical protein
MNKSHRGISQIVGSMFMLAIVVPIGAVILSQGMHETAEFNYAITSQTIQKSDAVQEDIIFEHIRFVPNSKEVIISLRNTGSIDTFINKISIIKMDTQELVVSQDNLAPFLSLKDSGDVSVTANLPLSDWGAMKAANPASEYKISLITSRGNFFDTIGRPFNT